MVQRGIKRKSLKGRGGKEEERGGKKEQIDIYHLEPNEKLVSGTNCAVLFTIWLGKTPPELCIPRVPMDGSRQDTQKVCSPSKEELGLFSRSSTGLIK